jgi:hypothetical protein
VALLAICVQAGFLLNLVIDPEDGDHMFLRNVDRFSTVYAGISQKKELLVTNVVKTSDFKFSVCIQTVR